VALFVLTSASGSPGVSTVATGLAYNWPRPVLLIDADPTGSSALLAGHFRGELEPGPGLIDLAVATAEGHLDEAFPTAITKLPNSDVRFLAGVRSHEQARSLRSLWPQLLGVLRRLDEAGQDVVVDAGRLGLVGSPLELIDRADVVVLVTRNSLVSLAGARSWATGMRSRFAEHGGNCRLGMMVVDDIPRRVQAYGGDQVARALQLPVIASVPHDKDAAEVYSHGAPPLKSFESSSLVKAYAAAAEALRLVHARTLDELAGREVTRQNRIATAARSLAGRGRGTPVGNGASDV
jgi:MinD-like ATPase involved in chromosome partitioning or flagellar assembly